MKKTVLCFLLLCGFSAFGATLDDMRFEPPVVRQNEDFEILAHGTWPGLAPEGAHVRIEPGRIAIEFSAVPKGPLPIERWSVRERIGGLLAGTYDVVVRADGTDIGRETLTVLPKPFELAPSFGSAGSRVLVSGYPLRRCIDAMCAAPRVFFGETEATNVVISGRGLAATVPGGSGTVGVTVENTDGSRLTLPAGFTYAGATPDASLYERVLFPVNYGGSGAHGSEWASELLVRNDAPISVATVPSLWFNPPLFEALPPGAWVRMPEAATDGGALLHVPFGLEKHLRYSSHFFDRSRGDTDRGSEIPVVRAKDTSSVLRILDVPLRELFRARLRVYDFDAVNGRQVLVRVHVPQGDPVPLWLELSGAPVCADGPCFPDRPAFASIDLSADPRLANAGNVDLTIDGERSDVRLWAFVTVSNNETQRVTVYSPQHATPAEVTP